MWKYLIVVVFSLIWAVKASEGEFNNSSETFNLEKSKTGCNSLLTHNNSRFELNNHTLPSPCYWNISAPGKIRLFFFDIFLHEKDVLNIYPTLEDALNGTNSLLKNNIQSQNGTLTIVTDETKFCIFLKGGFPNYDRILDGFYSTDDCSVPVAPDVEIIYPPTYMGNFTVPVECEYRFNQIPHKRVIQAFTFEEFNMPSSSVTVKGSTLSSEEYTAEHHPTDFFIHDSVLSVTVKQAVNSTDHFKLKVKEVDKKCSGKFEITKGVIPQLISPSYELNNGTITAFECRWLVESRTSTDILGIKFDKLNFSSVFDIVAINDGRSEISSPLLQVTMSNRNETQDQLIRASGSSLWIAFKPLNYESTFVGNITIHEQGGYFKNEGSIKMHSTDGDDTAFLLEVKDDEIVMLSFDESSITPPAVVSVYDGFEHNNLLTTLQGQVKFPVLSRSSRMMVTGTKFSAGSNHFSAKFKGIAPSCNRMSSSTTGNYILAENCNSSCVWVIPPQNAFDSALVVYLQYLSLKEGDNLTIHKLDGDLTELVKIGANDTYVPHISVPSTVGVLINISQAECKVTTDKIVFIGHSSYIPACDKSITAKTSGFLQLSSPLYPDTYPVFSKCQWNISASKEMIVHLAFQSLKLAKNHCIKISQKSAVIKQFEGKELPNDLFLFGDVLVDFDSAGCNKTLIGKTLNSDTGFLLNMTTTECGAVLDGKSNGEFNTSMTGSQTICIWKVSVPPTNENSVNVISYVINEKNKLKNYEFHVYDGSSVRDTEIVNNTGSQIWSRTNTLIFVYKRLNALLPSGLLELKYNKITCETLCDNKMCMHPDWKCDGVNDCGDFSDERNCGSVPVPPEIKTTGYTATSFWLCLIAMTIIGVILGITVPVCYQRYKDSRYRRFHELDTS